MSYFLNEVQRVAQAANDFNRYHQSQQIETTEHGGYNEIEGRKRESQSKNIEECAHRFIAQYLIQINHQLLANMMDIQQLQAMQKIQISQKLKEAKITPIEWPKVSQYVEDVLITILHSVVDEKGDNQYEASKQIKIRLESIFKGNWIVIICPADQKTYNIHYTALLAPQSKYQAFSFTFQYLTRRYLIFKAS